MATISSSESFAQDAAPPDSPTSGEAEAVNNPEVNPSAASPGPGDGSAVQTEFKFMDTLHTIWHATLFTAGDQEIKLNQIIVALMTMIIGLWITKRLTRFFAKRLIGTKRVSENIAETLSKIAYYVAAAMVVLIAMQVAGIPTTIFTVLGGALAIGVGFGAQNLFNNLISGIIILTEKPIRKNDIVEVDGTEGIVAEIGNRRTRIRRSDGVDVLVPNSTFLQSNVVNWTLFDAQVRGKIVIGVAYGSPVRTVRDLLLRAATEHGRVDKAPAPVVLFTDFGDSALIFELYFWCNIMRPLDRRQIESDLRFEIDAMFNDAKISIAFPQRDLHLDTLRPLEVRMVTESGPAKPA